MFKDLLLDLQKSKLVKVTGSHADKTDNEISDIDFYVKPDHPDYKIKGLTRHIEIVKKILDKHGIKVKSDLIGHWYTFGSENDIPVEMEFSDLYRPRKSREKAVVIYGVEFKTY